MRTRILILAAALALFSCHKEFKFSENLGVNSERVELSADGGSTPVIVYASGSWSASLAEGSSWARLEGASGDGIGQLKFVYDANPGIARKAVIEIASGGEVRRVNMVQKSGYGDVEFAFVSREISLPRNPASGHIPFNTNLPESEYSKIDISVLTEDGRPVTWLSSMSVNSSSLDLDVEGATEDRTAIITLSYADAMDNVYSTTLKLVQKNAAPYLNFSEDVMGVRYSSLAATVELPYTTNLVPYMKEIVAASGSSASWAKISIPDDGSSKILVEMEENTTPSVRIATLTFPFTDANGVRAPFTYILSQKGVTPRLSFSDVKALVTGSSYEFLDDGALEAVVISDSDDPNRESNPSKSPADIDRTLNARTLYIQSADGSDGFRLHLAAGQNLEFHRGDQITLDLNELTILKETEPLRYTIEGVTSGNISFGERTEAVIREKRLSELTDSDLYTLVKIKDVEMSFKWGAYTNCHDGYSYPVSTLNPAGKAVNASGSSSSPQKFDTTPCSMFDAAGNEINLLINNDVPWRRYGNGVPQGKCDVTGVLVHSDLIRWGRKGWIGRYQLRPKNEDDIAPTGERFSSVIVSWRWPWSTTQLKNAAAKVPFYPENADASYSLSSNLESLSGVAVETVVGYNDLTNYNASDTPQGYYKGQVKNGAISFATPSGSAFWASSNVDSMDGAPWFQITFPTSGLSGSSLLLVWSAAQGSTSAGRDDLVAPTQYIVEYSTDGSSFTAIETIYAMHPIVNWSGEVDNGYIRGGYSVPGLHQYVSQLPATLLGRTKVWVRIKAASNVSSNGDYTDPEGGKVRSCSTPVRVRFSELTVLYN